MRFTAQMGKCRCRCFKNLEIEGQKEARIREVGRSWRGKNGTCDWTEKTQRVKHKAEDKKKEQVTSIPVHKTRQEKTKGGTGSHTNLTGGREGAEFQGRAKGRKNQKKRTNIRLQEGRKKTDWDEKQKRKKVAMGKAERELFSEAKK